MMTPWPRQSPGDGEESTMAKELKRKAQEAAAQAQDAVEAVQAAAQEARGAHESHFWNHLGWLLLGTGLGALATYMLDPDRGRRRQALLRDQVVHARTVVGREVPKRVRHVQNRLQGVQHELGL